MTNTESKIFDTSQVAFDIIQMAPRPFSVLFYFVPQDRLARGTKLRDLSNILMEKPFAVSEKFNHAYFFYFALPQV